MKWFNVPDMSRILIFLIIFLIPISVNAQTSGHCFAKDNSQYLKAMVLEHGSKDLPIPPDYFYGAGQQTNGFILTNSVNGKVGILLINQDQVPALYPLLHTKKCCTELQNHSLKDMLAHWSPIESKRNQLKFIFFGWNKSKWEPFEIDLRFQDNRCIAFRVNCGIRVKRKWCLTKDIPNHENWRTKDGKLKLPIELGICEGPRDMFVCGVDVPPTTKHDLEALKLKKCAKTYISKDMR